MTHAAIEELTPPLEAIVRHGDYHLLTIFQLLGLYFLLDVGAVAVEKGVVVIHCGTVDSNGWWLFPTCWR